MSDELLDPEILEGFIEESSGLLEELVDIVESLEDLADSSEFPANLLSEFAQKIDRIMGAAQTLEMMDPDHPGVKNVGVIAEICKKSGYKAVVLNNSNVIPVFAGFWAETLDVLEDYFKHMSDREKCQAIADSSSKVLLGRLKWLFEAIESRMEDSSVSGGCGKGGQLAQENVDDLLKKFG